MIKDDIFYLAVHLYNKRPFANPIARNYNKIELTNGEVSTRGQWTFDNLIADEAFQAALNTQPYKTGWFAHLEEKYK